VTTPTDARTAALAAIRERLGPRGIVDEPAAQAPFLTEWRDRYRGAAQLIVQPETVEEVAFVVARCAEAGAPITPQGGNTGLVGGQIPTGPEVLLSLSRLNRIRTVDADAGVLVAEAGCVLQTVQEAAAATDRLFPLSLASEGSAQIGGLISTNAGGVAVLRYGSMRELVLGLEVVLPDGRIWNGLRALRKDNTGLDLKQLFIGAEGVLGVVTAAALKLHPRPRARAVAFVALADLEAATRLLGAAQAAAGDLVSSFEFVPRIGLEFVLRHIPGARDPFPEAHPVYALIELAGAAGARAALEGVLAEALDAGRIADAVLAENETQAAQLWRLREALSEAQKPEGGSIKHDISVPLGAIAEFVARADAAVAEIAPGARPVAFGHVGDGNVHYNVSQPPGADRDAFLSLWPEVSRRVHDIAHDLGGSISAEHGIGVMKRDEILRYKSPVEIDMMRRIKAALDPGGLMNPGKLIDAGLDSGQET